MKIDAQNLWKSVDGNPLCTPSTGTNKVKIQKMLCPSQSQQRDDRTEHWKCPKISFGAQVMGVWNKHFEEFSEAAQVKYL